MRSLIRRALLVTPLLLAACGFDFESKGILLDRRVLAISAEPPEIIIGVSDLSKPVQFRALVVDPKTPTEPQAYEWRWCIPTFGPKGNYDIVSQRCEETGTTLADQGAALLPNLKLDLLPQAVIDTLKSNLGDLAALFGSAGGGTGGQSSDPAKTPAFTGLLMAQLKVADDSTTPLFAVKRIALSTPGPGNRTPNQNPHLTALLFDGEPWEPTVAKAVKIGNCTADKKASVVDKDGPKNARGQRPVVDVCEHRITPVYDDAQAENYEAQTFDKDADGNFIVEKAKEKLRFDWTITDNGTLSENVTEENSPIGPQSYDPTSVKWREPPRLKGDTMQLWIVVRDGRGGETWETRLVTLSQ